MPITSSNGSFTLPCLWVIWTLVIIQLVKKQLNLSLMAGVEANIYQCTRSLLPECALNAHDRLKTTGSTKQMHTTNSIQCSPQSRLQSWTETCLVSRWGAYIELLEVCDGLFNALHLGCKFCSLSVVLLLNCGRCLLCISGSLHGFGQLLLQPVLGRHKRHKLIGVNVWEPIPFLNITVECSRFILSRQQLRRHINLKDNRPCEDAFQHRIANDQGHIWLTLQHLPSFSGASSLLLLHPPAPWAANAPKWTRQ